MITVRATREGLFGGRTSSGYRIDDLVPFVALPSYAALHLWVRVTNPLNGKSVKALVLDVGPHNEHDNGYVFQGRRPAAERGFAMDIYSGRPNNGAGIDLGEIVWRALDMKDNTDVEWEFV